MKNITAKIRIHAALQLIVKGVNLLLCNVCVFQSGSLIDRVFNTYKLMHTNQTLDFVKQKVSKSGGCEQKFSKVSLKASLLG